MFSPAEVLVYLCSVKQHELSPDQGDISRSLSLIESLALQGLVGRAKGAERSSTLVPSRTPAVLQPYPLPGSPGTFTPIPTELSSSIFSFTVGGNWGLRHGMCDRSP